MTKEPKKKQRYSWWPYIREIVQEYPGHKAAQCISGLAQREKSAVEDAVFDTERITDGQSRMKLIRLLHWDRTHTLDGAALVIPCSRRTAAYWQREFFEMVARNRDLLD